MQLVRNFETLVFNALLHERPSLENFKEYSQYILAISAIGKSQLSTELMENQFTVRCNESAY